MSQQTIGTGTVANDGTGDPVRTAFGKCNSNFTELYSAVNAAQPLDADLTALAAFTIAANTFPARSSSGALAAKTITDFGLSLVDDADAATARTTLGLGTLATQSGTFSGTSSGINTGDQTSVSGNAGTATALATPRAINGTNFDGTAAITVTAAAGTLTGTTLASNVVTSSLTSVGTLTGGATGAGFTIALTTSTVTGTLPAAQMPALTGAVTSSAGAVTTSQVISRGLNDAVPTDRTYVLDAKAAFAYTINQLRGVKTSAGTLSIAVKINGTDVTGLGAVSVTSTPQDVTATAANVVSAGDRVTLVVSGSSSPADLELTLKATR
jgi:hypothetical protein